MTGAHEFGSSARRVAATIVDIARTRIELAGTELAVHEVNVLRQTVRPPPWTGVALASAAGAAAWWARAERTRREPASQTTASVWALRGLTLWRAVRALRRVWLAQRSRHSPRRRVR